MHFKLTVQDKTGTFLVENLKLRQRPQKLCKIQDQK